jgi:CheY-like chemotaxis protein
VPDPEALTEVMASIAAFVERPEKAVLVVDDDPAARTSIVELLGNAANVTLTAVGSSEEAIAELEDRHFDCLILDLKLPKMTGFALLETIKADARFHDLPVIVYTGAELSRGDETRLKKYAEAIIIKSVASPERLLEEANLFLHRAPAHQSPDPGYSETQDDALSNRRVLIVDDDVRNVFALTSTLESRGMEVVFAENGREGLDVLSQNPDIELVLMDIMMPEMDGYETTRAIRSIPALRELPIIALTAKAMKEDRDKSMAAGASDYITKPVDVDQLLSLMRVWLHPVG